MLGSVWAKIVVAVLIIIIIAGISIWYLFSPATMEYFALTRPPPQGQNINGSIESGGLTRTYLLHIPPSYDGTHPVPLLLVFHGGFMTGSSMAILTGMSYTADMYGFLAVYPDGYDNHWNDGRNVTSASKAGVDDVGFVSNLIDALSNQYNIDLNRVYAVGFSDGGFFSHRLACQLPGKIAAIATVSGSMPPATAVSCNPGRPISALIIHGTADPLVPFNGGNVSVPPLLGDGGWVLSFNATVERWVQLDGCATTPVTTELPMAVNDGTSVVRDSYGPCAQGTAVEAYIIDGGGHTWPDGPQYFPTSIVGKASQNLNASQVIWAFLQQYSLPQTG